MMPKIQGHPPIILEGHKTNTCTTKGCFVTVPPPPPNSIEALGPAPIPALLACQDAELLQRGGLAG